MSEYYTGIQGFSDANHYVGPNNTLLGRTAAAGGFLAAALFSIRGSDVGGVQTIFANRDGAPGGGWELRFDTATGAIIAAIQGTLAEVSIEAIPDVNFIHTPILAMLGLLPGPQFVLILNDVLLGTAVNVPVIPDAANPYVAPAGTAPTVGVRTSTAPTQGAGDCIVHGVAYTENIAILGGGAVYLTARQAKDLYGVTDTDASIDFQNRWSAKQSNFQPGAGGVGVTPWTPQVGALNLTRVGSPTLRAFKDLDWRAGYFDINVVNPVPPP